MLGYFGVSTTRRTLTWTTWSLTCVCVIFACVYSRGTSVYSLIRRTFVESAQNLTPEKSQGGRKTWHITGTHPFGDHAPSCLTSASALAQRHWLSGSNNKKFKKTTLSPCFTLMWTEGRAHLCCCFSQRLTLSKVAVGGSVTIRASLVYFTVSVDCCIIVSTVKGTRIVTAVAANFSPSHTKAGSEDHH